MRRAFHGKSAGVKKSVRILRKGKTLFSLSAALVCSCTFFQPLFSILPLSSFFSAAEDLPRYCVLPRWSSLSVFQRVYDGDDFFLLGFFHETVSCLFLFCHPCRSCCEVLPWMRVLWLCDVLWLGVLNRIDLLKVWIMWIRLKFVSCNIWLVIIEWLIKWVKFLICYWNHTI